MTIIVLIFLIGHIIADFYLQSTRLAQDKTTKLSRLIQHIIIYSFVMLILGGLAWDLDFLLLAVSLAVVHALIDYGKFVYTKNRQLSKGRRIRLFLVDQLLHFLSIIAVITVFNHVFTLKSTWLNAARSFFDATYVIGLQDVLQWILVLLIIIKPASIVVRMSLSYFDPIDVEDEKPGIFQAGEFIGILERLIILVLLASGAYTAIAFVLTAKSIVRYNMISIDPKFAEYYLIGTLVSTLIVLVMYPLIFI